MRSIDRLAGIGLGLAILVPGCAPGASGDDFAVGSERPGRRDAGSDGAGGGSVDASTDAPDDTSAPPDDGGAEDDGAGGAGGSGGAGGTGGSAGSGGAAGSGGSGGSGGGSVCPAGAFLCSGATKRICDGAGGYQFVDCAPGTCNPVLGCVVCDPAAPGTCNGSTSTRCKPDGSGFQDTYCDPVQGVSCDAATGSCTGVCSPDALGSSYIGCDYYPTVTGNEVLPVFDFAVAISNTVPQVATVTIDGGALGAPLTFTVAANSVKVQTLPWVDLLKGECNPVLNIECGPPSSPGALAKRGAYHLRSTLPVTVYQFSALQYQKGSQYSYTNDASLLLPSNAWTTNYVAAAWPAWNALPSLLAVTASHDGTTVTITTKTSTGAGNGAPAFTAGTPGKAVLDAGDVLELFGKSGDLTGSIVSSDKPVQVIGGHDCSQVPIGVAACDHLEESMFPVETLGTQYLVTSPAVPSLPNGKAEVVRIVAAKPNVTLTFDPPQPGVGTYLANVGDFVQITGSAGNFQVSATDRILVAQYMEGQEAGGGSGDPAMALAVANAQFRDSYLFHAPVSYDTNYVNVTAPTGATITLDGTIVGGFTPIGGSGYGVARATLSKGGNGNHTITGSAPFGITVYGYGQYTSYWYPGGLNLRKL